MTLEYLDSPEASPMLDKLMGMTYVDVNTPAEALKNGEISFVKVNPKDPIQVHWRNADGSYREPVIYPLTPADTPRVAPKARKTAKYADVSALVDAFQEVAPVVVNPQGDSPRRGPRGMAASRSLRHPDDQVTAAPPADTAAPTAERVEVPSVRVAACDHIVGIPRLPSPYYVRHERGATATSMPTVAPSDGVTAPPQYLILPGFERPAYMHNVPSDAPSPYMSMGCIADSSGVMGNIRAIRPSDEALDHIVREAHEATALRRNASAYEAVQRAEDEAFYLLASNANLASLQDASGCIQADVTFNDGESESI